jgi:hypothetical protein
MGNEGRAKEVRVKLRRERGKIKGIEKAGQGRKRKKSGPGKSRKAMESVGWQWMESEGSRVQEIKGEGGRENVQLCERKRTDKRRHAKVREQKREEKGMRERR